MPTEITVPELPGYVWLGGPDPLQKTPGYAGRYIGYLPGTLGHCIEVVPSLSSRTPVTSYQLVMPSALDQWRDVMHAAGVPPGGLMGGTPSTVVWDALAQSNNHRVFERTVYLPKRLDEYEALESTLLSLTREVTPSFPDEIVKTYRILT